MEKKSAEQVMTEDYTEMLERNVDKLQKQLAEALEERIKHANKYETEIHELKQEVEKHKNDALDNYLKSVRYETAFKMLVKEIKEAN